VEIITPADMEYVGVTSCPGGPGSVTSGNLASCTGNFHNYSLPAWVNGANKAGLPSETGGTYTVDCLNQPNYGVSYEFNPASGYPYAPGVLSRWQGGVDLTMYKPCGGALMIFTEFTDSLKGVPLTAVQRLGYRVRRNLPAVSSVTSSYNGINFNLNLGFDFDTDTTTFQGNSADTAAWNADTVYQSRLLYFGETSLNAWTEVNAIYKVGTPSAAPNEAVWSRSGNIYAPTNSQPSCWLNGANPIVCSAQQIWTNGATASYPYGAPSLFRWHAVQPYATACNRSQPPAAMGATARSRAQPRAAAATRCRLPTFLIAPPGWPPGPPNCLQAASRGRRAWPSWPCRHMARRSCSSGVSPCTGGWKARRDQPGGASPHVDPPV
jgi:hypothetical protein